MSVDIQIMPPKKTSRKPPTKKTSAKKSKTSAKKKPVTSQALMGSATMGGNYGIDTLKKIGNSAASAASAFGKAVGIGR